MINKELLEMIDIVTKNIKNSYNLTDKEHILASALKIAEEAGELSSEILVKIWRARQKKIDHFDQDNMEWEFADVILSTLVLANMMDIDINQAIKNKIEKIKKRWGI